MRNMVPGAALADKNKMFHTLLTLKEPRYKVAYESKGNVTLDAWHKAYATLAESFLRTRV